MTSAHLAASATVPTSRPASSAFLALAEPGRRPTLDVDAGVLEVERVGVALRAVADDGDFFRLDEGEVCVCVVVGLCHLCSSFCVWGGYPSPSKVLRKS